MTNVKFDNTRVDAGMTSDLFKLIDAASPSGENKKGLFASFKKTAVKLSRRSIGKEFEHQALAGPSFSAPRTVQSNKVSFSAKQEKVQPQTTVFKQ